MKQSPRVLSLSLILVCLVTSACSHRKAKPEQSAEAAPSTSIDQMGPPLPPGQQPPQEMVGPQPLPGPELPPGYKPPAIDDGVVLVLGPGLARTTAFLGVLKEIEARHIKIKALVGVEMGAVVAAIYGTRGINALEWYLTKFTTKTLLDFPILRLVEKIADGDNIEKFLASALKDKSFEKSKIPLYFAVEDAQSREIVMQHSGDLVAVLRAAVAIPGVIKPGTVDGKRFTATDLEEPYPIKFARSLELGKTIAVDVLGSGDSVSAKGDTEIQINAFMKNVSSKARELLPDADGVIYVKTAGAPYLDFSGRADMAYHGKMAVAAWLQEEARQ